MFLQRHGESETNLTKTFTCRRLDPRLTEKGRRQVEEAASWYASLQIRRIVTSPSKRAVESAEILGARLGIGPQIHDCLLEVDVGDLEGRSEQDPKLLGQFYSVIEDWLLRGKNTAFPQGESLDDVRERLKTFDSLLVPGFVILVGHTTLFAVFLGTRGMPFRNIKELFLPRAGIAEYSLPGKSWRMKTRV